VDYRRAAAAAVNGLRQQAEALDLLRAWRSGVLPRQGRLARPKGRYTFHGVGCRFEIARRVVDVDFGPDNRYDGFDAWRLALYAASAFEWQDLPPERIGTGLAELEVSGLIHRPGAEPAAHLYYLAV